MPRKRNIYILISKDQKTPDNQTLNVTLIGRVKKYTHLVKTKDDR